MSRPREAVFMVPKLPTQSQVDQILGRFTQPPVGPLEWQSIGEFCDFAIRIGYMPTAYGVALYVLGSRGVLDGPEDAA